ncbi:Actin- protein 8 [Branchiostoma belcheri]|nr:Actin- protein 8 [Branchiostoma belcheri]
MFGCSKVHMHPVFPALHNSACLLLPPPPPNTPQVLYLHPSESYNVHWPMSCGQLHLHSGTGGSLTAVLADLETIWTTAIEKFLDIPVKDLKDYTSRHYKSEKSN